MLIKRYPNRKLYDTQARQYITLEGVADLLRKGEEVHVVDYASGADLTAQVLSQVIAGQEKKRQDFVPRPVLAGLIQAGGATLEVMRRAMLLPLDLLRHVDDEIQHRVEELIQRGELTEAEGMLWLDKLLSPGPYLVSEAFIEGQVKQIVFELGSPTRQDFEQLEEQVTELGKKIDERMVSE
jgi:polyhydroxyalkanoate synthesis repressor PhaR